MTDANAAAIENLEAELRTATGDRRLAIEASLRSLRNDGVRTDLEAQAREGIIDHADLPADVLAAPLVSPTPAGAVRADAIPSAPPPRLEDTRAPGPGEVA